MNYESTYGQFRPQYRWLMVAAGIIGLVAVPVGIFGNKGWRMGVRPMEPWQVTVIVEIFAVGALAAAASGFVVMQRNKTSPQRVAVTDTSLIVPKGMFSREELVLPLASCDLKVFDVGFVKQLQIKHGRQKLLLTSARFPSDEDFEQFVAHLPLNQ